MVEKEEKKSLKRRILIFLLLCWIVPIGVFFLVTTLSYRESIVNKTEGLIEDRLDTVLSYASIRLDAAISAAQKPSYERVWENAWLNYQNGEKDRNEFLKIVNRELKYKYGVDERFDTYAFYINGEEETGCYSSRAGKSYNNYMESVENDIKKVAAYDTSYAYVRIIDKRMFVIRNLYTTKGYKRFGTLVLELNINKVFEDVPEDLEENLVVCMDEPGAAIDFATAADAGAKQLITDAINNYDNTISGELFKDTNHAYNVYLLRNSMIIITLAWSIGRNGVLSMRVSIGSI